MVIHSDTLFYVVALCLLSVFCYIERPDGTSYSHEIVLRAKRVIL